MLFMCIAYVICSFVLCVSKCLHGLKSALEQNLGLMKYQTLFSK